VLFPVIDKGGDSELGTNDQVDAGNMQLKRWDNLHNKYDELFPAGTLFVHL